MIIRLAETKDIPFILTLQKKYLFDNLSDHDKNDGFVTTPFTINQIQEVIAYKRLFVALDGEKLAAYIFTGSWKFFSQWAIFPYMTSRFPIINFNGQAVTEEKSFQYGPICIDMEYRNQGLIYLLFEYMRQELMKEFSLGITFINKQNKRSYAAHVNKLNWTVIDEFNYNDRAYWTLAYDMKVPVVSPSVM